MTSVAYPVEPRLPGWGHTAISLIFGWLVGAAAAAALYGVANLIGAIDTPYATHAGVLNEWPYHGDSLWALLANFSVILIVVLLTALATSYWLRRKHPRISDGRLAIVLLLTGWIPLAARGPVGGVFGFLVALVLVRHWVARHEGKLPLTDAGVIVATLSAVVLSYGLLHPLWTTGVVTVSSGAKSNDARVIVRNAAPVGITVDLASMQGFDGPRPSRLRIGPRSTGVFALTMPVGCGDGVFGIDARYHLLGLTLRETLPARISFRHGC